MVRSLTIYRIVGMLSFLMILSGCFRVNTRESYLSLTCTDLSENICDGLASESFCPGTYPSECWWHMFGDPQLNKMMELALSCHPTIEEARQRINIAYERALEVRSKLLPKFDLIGSISRNRESKYDIGIPAFVPLVGNDNLWFPLARILFQGSYELDIWGKNRASYYSSLGALQGQVADLAQARLTLSVKIAEAYFNLQSHMKQAELLSSRVKDQKDLVDLMWQRFLAGQADEFFPFITDTQEAIYIDQLEIMQGLIEGDLHTLAALVGNIDSLCNGSAKLCVAPAACYHDKIPLPCSLPLDLITHRPDIMASIWNIQSKGYEIKVAKARFFPNLDLLGNIGSAAFTLSKFMTANAMKFLGQGESLLPVFTAGELKARLGQAQAELDLAVATYNDTLLMAVKEVSDGISNLKIADERYAALTEALSDSRSVTELTRQRYENKIATRISYLNAELATLEQEFLREQVWLTRMLSIVEMIRSLGGGYQHGC